MPCQSEMRGEALGAGVEPGAGAGAGAPHPEAAAWASLPLSPEDIVVSGISGQFPNTSGIQELRDNLFEGKDLFTNARELWGIDHPDLPIRIGKFKAVSKFDAEFFDVPPAEAEIVDPQNRLLFEATYEALVDAGVHPVELEGRRCAVIVGACISEAEKDLIYDHEDKSGFAMIGAHRTLLASRLAGWLKVKGASYVADTACSSSLYAMEQAVRLLREGRADCAIVAGSNELFYPVSTMQFFRLGVLSKSTHCRPFDADADGYIRSETAAVAFLQKAKDARRAYGAVVHAETNSDGYKELGITYPSRTAQAQLLRSVYSRIDARALTYMEAHGTGTRVGDPEELFAIDEVLFKEGRRAAPLLVGSVKASVGHSEGGSGIGGLAKLVILLQEGVVPPTKNYKRPREGVEPLETGRLKVVAKATPWPEGLLGLNNFGFGGGNAHVVLRPTPATPLAPPEPSPLPLLVTASGRTEEAVASLLDAAERHRRNPHFAALLHHVHARGTPAHRHRGYTLLPPPSAPHAPSPHIVRETELYLGERRPVWLVFSGLGSQWPGMGVSLMRVPVFADAVRRCQVALAPRGVDVLSIITSDDPAVFGNNVNCYVGIVAVQVGLVDILRTLGIAPDGRVGFSVGELSRAYAQQLITAEEAALGAFLAGSRQAKELIAFLRKTRLGARSAETVAASVLATEADAAGAAAAAAAWGRVPRGSFALDVTPGAASGAGTAHTALRGDHSLVPLMHAVGRLFLCGQQPRLTELYPKVQFPVPRGTPMISPLVKWDHSRDWFVAGKYGKLTDRSEQTERIVHGDVRDAFLYGHVIDGRALVPATAYLVFAWDTLARSLSRLLDTTPVLIEDVQFLRATHLPKDRKYVELAISIQWASGEFEVSDRNVAVVRGRVSKLVPGEGDGCDAPLEDYMEPVTPPPTEPGVEDAPDLTQREVYKTLRLRGYNYSGAFRGLVSASADGRRGLVKWDGNWVTFLDCLLQMTLLGRAGNDLAVPTALKRVAFIPRQHSRFAKMHDTYGRVIEATYDPHTDTLSAGAVQISGLRANVISRRPPLGEPVLERYDFVAYDAEEEDGEDSEDGEDAVARAVRMSAQLALENRPPLARPVAGAAQRLNVVEVLPPHAPFNLLSPHLLRALADLPLIQAAATLLSEAEHPEQQIEGLDVASVNDAPALLALADVVAGPGLVLGERGPWLEQTALLLPPGACMLSLEAGEAAWAEAEAAAARAGLTLVLRRRLGASTLLLLRKGAWEWDPKRLTVLRVPADERDFSWLEPLRAAMADAAARPERRVVLLAAGAPLSGALGLFRCLRQEPGPGRAALRLFWLPDAAVDTPFDPATDGPLRAQLERDLAVNAHEGGRWGCYRHLQLGAAASSSPALHVYYDALTPGDLSSITPLQGRIDIENPKLVNGEQLVHVYYATLNFRDIMIASGKLNASVIPRKEGQDSLLGFEYSGRLEDGRRVMGVCLGGGLSTAVTEMPLLFWDVPDSWTLEQAASVPVAYYTAIYALISLGHMKRGESVLIHAGSGGVGQAAINLCLFFGCRVFATVGTPEKKEFILRRFPELHPEDIGNSRDTTFEQMVMRRTGGRGVDLVLNSLADDKLLASVRCLADKGRFLEIGKADMQMDTKINADLLRGRSFIGVLLDKFWAIGEAGFAPLHRLFTDLLNAGALKPLPTHVFARTEVEQAYRFMAAGKHMGKVVVRMRDAEESDRRARPAPLALPARRRFQCDEDCCYVICGGLGGLGLELAEWLVSRHARNLILTSRSGVSTGYQARKLLLWRRAGVHVVVSTLDTATMEGASTLLRQAATMGDVAAIFNLAVVLQDGLFENQTEAKFAESVRCKATATKCLDAASRQLCPRLRHFVVFSSVSCGRGNAGQTNYGLANAVMEGVVRARRAAGLPGTAVQWGAVGDVGLVADMRDDDRQLEIGGTLQQRLSSCLEVLDGFLSLPHPVLASMVVAEKKAGAAVDDLVECVAGIFGIQDVKTVSPESTLAELGLDSMMAVEIQQTLARDFDVDFSAQEVRALTFARLRELQEQQLKALEARAGEKEGEEKQPKAKAKPKPEAKVTFDGPAFAEGAKDSQQSLLNELGALALRGLPELLRHEASEVPPPAVVTLGDGQGTGECEPPVFLLPGIEGVALALAPLAQRLQAPALGLQMQGPRDPNTVQAIVDDLMPYVRSRLGSAPFRLLGHSLGGLLALEVAARLEAEGRRGAAVLVDSAPDYLRAFYKRAVGATDPRRMPNALVEACAAATVAAALAPDMTAHDIKKLRVELAAAGGWAACLNSVQRLAAARGVDDEAVLKLADAMRTRGLALRDYTGPPAPLRRTRVALLRPARPDFDTPAHDYGLAEVCGCAVEVRLIEGVDHHSITSSAACAAAANEFLQHTLEEDRGI